MTKIELLSLIKDVPDTAEIYVEADHGQTPEKANSISFTHDSELNYYGDEVSWSSNTKERATTTAICISF